jgi:polynucleotide 5'-hydroxyl-kinase GRC3/NOL9
VGASQSGKSTFAKRLLNRYLSGQGKAARPLSAVCFLDLDPTQTEYTPPGQISLINVRKFNLGPSITHAAAMPMSNELGHNQVVRAHPLPLDTVNHATYYISCAEDLFLAYQKLRSRDPSLPLVINTSGAVYDSSFNVLQTLLSLLKPHNLIHLCDLQAINADDAPRLDSLHATTAQHHGSVYEVTAMAESEPRQLSKVESRAMQVQSYFHLRGQVAEGYEISRWLPDDISRLKPWEFCYQGSQGCSQDFLGFAVYTEPVESASLAHFLDGALVQVVQLAPNAQLHIDLSRTARFCIPFFGASRHKGIVDPLDPANSTLICTGLIRGFDPQRKVVQILFPRAYEDIIYSLVPDRTVLVGGCCESPEWAYIEGENRATMLCSSKSYGTNPWPDSRPWVESGALVEAMGFLNTVRRVRKFQT